VVSTSAPLHKDPHDGSGGGQRWLEPCDHSKWIPVSCCLRSSAWLGKEEMESPCREVQGSPHKEEANSKWPQWKVHLPPHPSAVYQLCGTLAS
jgi:hypothetical protein